MNQTDNEANSKAVDSLINYEVQYTFRWMACVVNSACPITDGEILQQRGP